MKLIAALVTLVALTFNLLAALPSSKPNIVFILADDLGCADLGCYGAKDIRTPRLDRLAREGVRFTQFYSNGPECSPTRTAFLTGRYQQRVGGLECAIGIGGVGRYDDAARLAAQHQLGLPATEPTLPRLLRDAGYATAITGKWHLGYEDHFAPSRHGFGHALYALGGGMDYFHHVEDPPDYAPALRLNGAPVKRRGYATDLFADEAGRWLREHAARNAKQPFFLYLPFTAPHSPFQSADEEQATPLPTDSERWKQGKAPPRVYAAMIERMDTVMGKLLDTLDELGVAKNTLIVFSSDNGGTASARPCGLRGIKGTTFEGGIRVPCFARWPGVLPAGVERLEPSATFDLTASFARAAGVTPPRPFDGVDVLGAIARGEPLPARALFWRGRRGERTWRAVRDGALKYVSRTDGAVKEEFLFDIARDATEEKNLLVERPADAARLKAKLAAWEAEVRPQR
ncbi:MAG: sulfatase-like hydrolase/transferase [Verrucomicrobia bacterium]|nr:sulfatase-like hydrolase/transferase [Verrucomicrobiota bacterium]